MIQSDTFAVYSAYIKDIPW